MLPNNTCVQKPIFQGESDLDQLVCIYRMLGIPTEEDWPVSATVNTDTLSSFRA